MCESDMRFGGVEEQLEGRVLGVVVGRVVEGQSESQQASRASPS